MYSFLFFPIIFFNAPFISFRFTIFVSFSYKPNLEIIYYYEKIHFSFLPACCWRKCHMPLLTFGISEPKETVRP